MVKIDPKIQAQVWQRVQTEQENGLSIHRLVLLEGEVAALLRALMPYFPGKRQILQQLLQQTQKHAACLQGAEFLRRGQRPVLSGVKPRVQDGAAAVRKCYVNCLSLANAYEQGRSDPEYGLVFGELAREKRQHCRELLALVGEKP